ncbi:hypothetical protein BG418_34315 [Streptomyces sp. CBMA152]|nr:hypothetical protein [Streptomyces sp. CBMA152]
MVAAALVVPVLLGAGVDDVLGHRPGWGMAVGAVVGAVWAALGAARREVLWWVAPLPALVVAAVTAGVAVISGSSGKTMTTRLVWWAVSAFPAMAAAECAVVVVAVVCGVRSSRSGRRSHA